LTKSEEITTAAFNRLNERKDKLFYEAQQMEKEFAALEKINDCLSSDSGHSWAVSSVKWAHYPISMETAMLHCIKCSVWFRADVQLHGQPNVFIPVNIVAGKKDNDITVASFLKGGEEE
jgi:hypothetical protein